MYHATLPSGGACLGGQLALARLRFALHGPARPHSTHLQHAPSILGTVAAAFGAMIHALMIPGDCVLWWAYFVLAIPYSDFRSPKFQEMVTASRCKGCVCVQELRVLAVFVGYSLYRFWRGRFSLQLPNILVHCSIAPPVHDSLISLFAIQEIITWMKSFLAP